MPDKSFPTLVELTSSQIEEVAQASGEPAWLIDHRIEAWNFFVQAIPPVWRRTDLTKLKPEHIVPLTTPQGTVLEWNESLANQGIVFSTLASAVKSHESIVQDKIGTAIAPLRHKFSALRAALWQDGIFLYVPKNVVAEIPLHVHYELREGSRSLFPYSLVILDTGAQVTFIEDFVSHDVSEPVVAGPTTEIFLDEGSALRFVSIQRWGANVYHIGGQAIVFGKDARSEWISVALGGKCQHIEAEAHLQGNGSAVTWYGATFANKQQNLLTAPLLRHTATHTESHLDFKTVVNDTGYSVVDGLIKIEAGSRATTTRLEEHAIHLSPESRSDSIPGLKIDTNNVESAGHACTSGEIDEEQIFYMQSRGISKIDAIRMIIMGLFEPVLNAIPSEELREALTTIIEARI